MTVSHKPARAIPEGSKAKNEAAWALKLTLSSVDGEETLLLRLDGEAHLCACRVDECEGALNVLLDAAVAELDASLRQAADHSLTRR